MFTNCGDVPSPHPLLIIFQLVSMNYKLSKGVWGSETPTVKQLNALQERIRKAIEKIIGHSITNGQQLDTLAKIICGKRFKGVYLPKDKKPLLKNGEGFIVNRPENIHWISEFKVGGKQFVFDSFDRQSFIKPFADGDFDHQPDQKISESDCGSRALSRLIIACLFGK